MEMSEDKPPGKRRKDGQSLLWIMPIDLHGVKKLTAFGPFFLRFCNSQLRVGLVCTGNILSKKVLCCMINVIVRKCCHGIIAMVVIRLEPDIDSFFLTNFFRCSNQILR